MLTVDGKWGYAWIKNWFEYVQDQTLSDILYHLLVLPVRYVIFMIQRRCAFAWNEIFFQFESDFNGILVNLKSTTDQEAMSITCSHNDN